MRVLKASHYSSRDFDKDETFTFVLDKHQSRANLVLTGYILDCAEDGMFLMQKSAMLKSHYTEKDHADRARLNAMEPIKSGDLVEVAGVVYKVLIKGDYSDAGRLIPVEA